jgi:hypothetical protein
MLVVPAEIGAPAKKVSGAAGTRAISRCWPANRERGATVSLTVGGPAIGAPNLLFGKQDDAEEPLLSARAIS